MLWGSFAKVCINRWAPSDELPKGRSVGAPGSHWFACKAPIKWYDNVPLVSWRGLRGRWRNCQAPVSARYLLVEASTGALFGVAWWCTMGPAGMLETIEMRLIRFVVIAAFVFVMVVITFIDIDTKYILDKITYPSIVIFYAATFLLPERRWMDGSNDIAVGYAMQWMRGEN